jgi:type I restriction enzyme S subunit
VSGATPDTFESSYWDGDICWATPKDLSELDGAYISDTPRKITRRGLESCAAAILPPESVLFSSRAPIGHVAINTVPMATNQGFKSFVPDRQSVDAKFLYHWLRKNRPYLQSLGNGATFKEVSKVVVSRIEIALPPLSEQRRIAEILDKADALRAKRRAALAQLDTLTQSIFLDMFGDPQTNPQKFSIKTLSQFYVNQVEGTKCGPFGSALKKSELVSDGIPVWNMDNIDPAGRSVLPFRMWIPESKYRQLEAYAVVDGDVIVSRAGTVGKMCVANTGGARSIISTNLIRVRFGPDLIPLYFVSLMTYCKGRVGRLKTGGDGAFTHMTTGILDTLRFPYPPLDRQSRFAAIVESIERQKSTHVAQVTELDTLFTGLQHRAFRGEL